MEEFGGGIDFGMGTDVETESVAVIVWVIEQTDVVGVVFEH